MNAYKIALLFSLFSCSLQAPWWGLQSALAFFAKFQFPKIQSSVDDQFADECIDKWVRKAIKRQDIEELKHLLSLKKSDGHGCDVNNIRVENRPAIYYAALENNYQMCELLLKAGANPNQPSGEGLNRTPIWKAISHENFLLAQLFINYGANINHKDNTDVHISAFCIVHQSLICLESLLALKKKDGSRAIDLNETTQGRSPLAITVNSTDKERLGRAKTLLQAGVDVNHPDKAYENRTPIWLSVQNGDLKMTELLIDHGANVNLRNSKNQTLLGHASSFMCPSVLEEILRCKPRDTNLHYSNGQTLLSSLATEQILHGKIGLRAIKMMLAAGAILEAQRFLDSPNQYELIMTSPNKNPAAIEFLEGAYLLKPGQYEKLHSSLFGQTVLHALEQRNQHPDQFLAMIDDDHLTPTEMIPTPIKQNIKNNFKKDALDKWIADFNEKLRQKKELH